jgi:hypothetical protein
VNVIAMSHRPFAPPLPREYPRIVELAPEA